MRALGHIRDDRRPEGVVHHERLVGGTFVPESVTLPARIDDQQGQSCTGSYGLLIETWTAARGITCDPVSRRFTYTLGRQLGGSPADGIRDVGARPRDVVQGLREIGAVAESTCPSGDLAQINEPVEFFSLEKAVLYRVKDIAVIEEDGAARCAAIRQALAAQYPVGFGMYVGPPFEGWRGEETYDSLDGTDGHALRCVGYAPGKFLIAGSWGPLHGFGGYCWISDRVMGSALAFDHYVMSFAPAVHE